MTKYSKVFSEHIDYSRSTRNRLPGKYLSFCEDIRDVHYDIVRPVQITFTITSNTSWYAPGYDYTDPSETATITRFIPAICTAGSNLEIDRVVRSSTDNFSTLTVTDDTSHIELAKVTGLKGRYTITEFNPSICDVSVTPEESGGVIISGALRINVKLYNISTNISLTFT